MMTGHSKKLHYHRSFVVWCGAILILVGTRITLHVSRLSLGDQSWHRSSARTAHDRQRESSVPISEEQFQWDSSNNVWSGLFQPFEQEETTTKTASKNGTSMTTLSRRTKPPGWWIDPRQCTSLAFECSRNEFGVGRNANKKQGDHIRDLDTCPPEAVAPVWSPIAPHWSDLLALVDDLPPRVQFLAIGDSTNQQQARSLNCFLEEALERLGDPQREASKVIVLEDKNNNSTIQQHVPDVWKRAACTKKVLHVTNQQQYLVCVRWASTSLMGEPHDIPSVIQRNLLTRGNDTDVHLVILINMGAWFNCIEQHCDTWHDQMRQFQMWWKTYQKNAPNTTLIVRDALPQHFGSEDGRYGTPMRTNGVGCMALMDRTSSGLQAVKVRDPEACQSGQSIVREAPERGLLRNPVWGITSRLAIHNTQAGDCTHYCTAVSTLWNVMMLGIVVRHCRSTLLSSEQKEPTVGETLVSALVNKSFEETRLDLLAANDRACYY